LTIKYIGYFVALLCNQNSHKKSHRKKTKMKNVLLLFLVASSFTLTQHVKAQTQKIGVFDIGIMTQAMPGYAAVDSLVGIYEQDSLKAEYDFAVSEYNRLDSSYKADSAAKKSATIINYQKDQRTQIATTIIYWQQISQQKLDAKRRMLAQPLTDRVLVAYKKVLDANNYLVILKPGAYEMGSRVDNVFERVAKELKIFLPDGLKSAPAPDDQQTTAPANPPKKVSPKPRAKKP
jgi:hypothetical protein